MGSFVSSVQKNKTPTTLMKDSNTTTNEKIEEDWIDLGNALTDETSDFPGKNCDAPKEDFENESEFSLISAPHSEESSFTNVSDVDTVYSIQENRDSSFSFAEIA